MKSIVTIIAVALALYIFGSQSGLLAEILPGVDPEKSHIIELNDTTFRELVFDYTKHQEWVFSGDKPTVVDFYATWCGPCKAIRPRLERLAESYKGQVLVCSIDVDKYPQIAQLMGVTSMPTIFMIPKEGTPTKHVGALPYPILKLKLKDILPKAAEH